MRTALKMHSVFLKNCKSYSKKMSVPLSSWFHYNLDDVGDSNLEGNSTSTESIKWPPKGCRCCGVIYSRSKSFARIKPKPRAEKFVRNLCTDGRNLHGYGAIDAGNSSDKKSSHALRSLKIFLSRLNRVEVKCRNCGWVESVEGQRRSDLSYRMARINRRSRKVFLTGTNSAPESVLSQKRVGALSSLTQVYLTPSITTQTQPKRTRTPTESTRQPTSSKKIFQKLNKNKLKALLNPSLQPATSSLQSFLSSVR